MRRLLAATSLALLLALVAAPSASGAEAELTFNITDTRAYAYKISVGKEVIQVAGLSPCNKQTDPYGCDKNRYNQQPNCPPPKAVALMPDPVKGVDLKSGGAGQGTGPTSGREPEGASPVKINELLTVGTITKAGPFLGSGGVASDTFVDLDGRANPEAHTESDAFVTNKNSQEERCDPANAASYVHAVSKSGQKPETYSFVECTDEFQPQEPRCGRSGSTEGRPSAKKAYSIVHLYESGGKVIARLKSFVSNMTMGSGTQSLGVESMTTYLSLESDGTRSGLKWSAISSASGVTLGGQPITLRPGDTVEAPGGCAPPAGCVGPTHVGLAGPYVSTSQDGTKVLMIAPGLFYATTTQTTYVAGAELRAALGRAIPFSFSALGIGSSSPLGLVRPGPAPFGSELPTDTGVPVATGPVDGGDPIVSVKRLVTQPVAFTSLIALGGLTLAVLLAGWIQRFAWGQKLYRMQPLRSINWMYRAFVRT
jgi:hypothetical protein